MTIEEIADEISVKLIMDFRRKSKKAIKKKIKEMEPQGGFQKGDTIDFHYTLTHNCKITIK